MSKRILIYISLLLALFLASNWGFGQIKVRHDHDPWGECEGELTITDSGIEFRSDKEEHNRVWKWLDIQTVDRLSDQQFSVLSYEDQKWVLGRDRPYDFTVLEGNGLDNSMFDLIMSKSPRPVVDRTVKAIDSTDYEVPVKHLHTFGGCEGTLRFGQDWILYESDHAEDSRTWRRDRDIAGIWSTAPFDLELEVYERDGGDLLRTRRFRFQLKEPLNEEYYAKLRREFLLER